MFLCIPACVKNGMKICTLFGSSVSIFLKTFVVKKCSIFVVFFSVGKIVNRRGRKQFESSTNIKTTYLKI